MAAFPFLCHENAGAVDEVPAAGVVGRPALELSPVKQWASVPINLPPAKEKPLLGRKKNNRQKYDNRATRSG
jgi:hypothetical protein